MTDQKRLAEVKNRLMGAMRDELTKGDITKEELLAIMGFATGACLAMQNQNTMTPAQGLSLIGQNIEAGNMTVLRELLAAGDNGRAH